MYSTGTKMVGNR